MSTDTLEHIDFDLDLDEEEDEGGEHDRFAHYVTKDDIARATFDGATVYALCGKKWVAKRNPDGLPVCQECKDIYENVVQKG